ncbi:MAG: hypothetical protein KJO55_08995, partial [Gammaproteobacteria bacterium]|nr:hypothetical protein [Gammaproteobacteria bacterium]
GDGALLTLDHQLNDKHNVYGTFTQSVDRTDLRTPGTQLAFGHRSQITDQAELYNERQFVEDRGFAGVSHVFGLDFEPMPGIATGLSVQQGELQSDQGTIERDAVSGTLEVRGERLNYRGKVEYRDESGISEIEQTLTTNRLDLRLSDNWRVLARLNHAVTEDRTLTDRDDNAVFTEAGIGVALRPVDGGKLNMLAKYTYLYDLPAPFQDSFGTDQRSHVFSLEGVYRLTPRWDLGGKLAQRSGELRIDRDYGEWFDSTTNFLAINGRFHVIRRWDALLEYRRIESDEADATRSGFLVSLDRHINDHLRLGLGYNFTDFSDDLTDFDYDHKGWFINAIGKY